MFLHPPFISLKSYQEMCRQLDALLASSCLLTQPEIKRRSRTPTAELPKDRSHNWPRWAGDVTHMAHSHICNELQEVHSSKLISIRPCHVIDFYEAALRTSATKNNYWECITPDPESSHHQWRAAAKRTWRLHLKVVSSRDNCSQIVCWSCSTSGSSCFNKYMW